MDGMERRDFKTNLKIRKNKDNLDPKCPRKFIMWKLQLSPEVKF